MGKEHDRHRARRAQGYTHMRLDEYRARQRLVGLSAHCANYTYVRICYRMQELAQCALSPSKLLLLLILPPSSIPTKFSYGITFHLTATKSG